MDEKVFEINGYVQNNTGTAHFKVQRPLPPASKLTFANAYKTLGKVSGKEGAEFVEWLRDTHFKGPGWGFYTEAGESYFSAPVQNKAAASETKPAVKAAPVPPVDPGKGAGKVMRRSKQNQKAKGVEITAESMISADFATARHLIEACKSRSELKKALNLSRSVAKKDEHMRHIHNRLQQV